jgi:cytochrome c biogenesis protein ResB
LFWTIIIVSFIGAVIPERLRGFVFGSGWFLALLAVFSLNILICSCLRITFSSRKTGSTVVHLSVLLILFGALMSYFFSVRGTMELEEGQSLDRINTSFGLHDLGFRVYLEDFSVVWYNSTPDKYEIHTFVQDKDFKGVYKTDKVQQQTVGDTGYSFAVIDYFPDLAIDENMKTYNRSGQPANPAVLLRINSPDGIKEERWVFADHPAMGLNRDQNILFKFNYQPMIKEFRSQVKLIDEKNNRTVKASIKVNSPFSYRGYSFYQAGYDKDNLKYTSLDVVRDPGVGVVFAGFIFLNFGLIIVFFPKLKPGKIRESGR